jgi:hypothetical protein
MTVRALAADAVAATAPNGMASVAKQSKREEKRGLGKPLERLKKIGFVWPGKVVEFKSDNRPVSPRGGAALVAVQLTQFWQHPSDGFRRSVRLV